MIVCGVDPSLTSAGVAVLQNGKPIHVSHHGYVGTKDMAWDDRAHRWVYVNNRVQEVIPDNVDLVVIEDIPATGTIMPSMRDRHVLWGQTYAQLRKIRKLPVVVVNPQTLKVWVTGRGSSRTPGMKPGQRQKQDKQLMIDTISSWWPDQRIACDDEADALGLAAIGAFHLGDPMPFDVKPRHTTGLEKVQWP